MNKFKKIVAVICLLYSFLEVGKPFVYMDLPALLGNRLWGFCVAKIIALELSFDLYCKPIYGFPNTYQYSSHYPHNNYPWQVHQHDQLIDIPAMVNNKALRNIKLIGYFQRYHYIEKYIDIIRNDWLKIDPVLLHTVDPDDIVVHVRIHVDKSLMKFEYYEKALAMAQYKQIYICTNEPKHSFMKNFDKYNPIMVSTREFGSYFPNISWDETTRLNTDEFAFMASFNKMIISYSTYAWWAALLSNATEIYAPDSNGPWTEYGRVNEARYTYIDTDIVYRAEKT